MTSIPADAIKRELTLQRRIVVQHDVLPAYRAHLGIGCASLWGGGDVTRAIEMARTLDWDRSMARLGEFDAADHRDDEEPIDTTDPPVCPGISDSAMHWGLRAPVSPTPPDHDAICRGQISTGLQRGTGCSG